MPQSLHVLSAHIIFSTKRRHPWLTSDVRERIWAYQSRILQNLGCSSITVGGIADHVHILCNLTKKFPTAKVLEILKKRLVEICKDTQFKSSRLSLAGRVRPFQRKPVAFRAGAQIHSESGRAPQEGDIPGGVSSDFKEISCAL
jgi:REP element-mobilizing transposase RayT